MIDTSYVGYIQWECGGAYVFEFPRRVTHFSECGEFVFVENATTGIPITQAIAIEPEPEKKYTYFWHGPFSQWYPSRFTIAEVTYNCAEQYMMASKAALFKDAIAVRSIMAAKLPKEQKNLGRAVKGFDAEAWNLVARDIVYKGNAAKFGQNTKLRDELFATAGTTLVEASPYDKIWGIGLNEAVARSTNPKNWPGTNWLGEVLTRLREDLMALKRSA